MALGKDLWKEVKTLREEGKITCLNYKTIIWRKKNENLGIKLTSHVLSSLKLTRMAPNSDFESQFFNPFSVNEDPQNNELDPDVNYYLDEISSLDTKYYVPVEVKDQLKSLQLNPFEN